MVVVMVSGAEEGERTIVFLDRLVQTTEQRQQRGRRNARPSQQSRGRQRVPKSKMGKVKEGILIRASKQLKGLTPWLAVSRSLVTAARWAGPTLFFFFFLLPLFSCYAAGVVL